MSATEQLPGRTRGPPLGIKLICTFGGILSVLSLVGGIAALGVAGIGAVPGASAALGVVGVIAIPTSVLSLVAYYGLWKLRYWAWLLYVVVQGVSLLLDLVAGNVIGILIGAVLLTYVGLKRDLYRYE